MSWPSEVSGERPEGDAVTASADPQGVPEAGPDDYHPGEERPDCPGCVAGKEHYHRKSDGSPVINPGHGAG